MIVVAIALNTFRETVRDKILYVLLFFGVMMILASRVLGYVCIAEGETKVMMDVGLTAIWIFSGLVSIFIGTGLIYKEIDKRTLYTILSKPTHRWQFLLGKYFGLLLTTWINLGVLSLIFTGYLWFYNAPITMALAQALYLTFIEMIVITSIAIFFSSASTPILSAIFTTMIFFSGQLTQWVVDLSTQQHLRASAPWLSDLLYVGYLITPNLHNFNVRNSAVSASHEFTSLAIPWAEVCSCTVYGISYATAVMLVAHLVFSRRNF